MIIRLMKCNTDSEQKKYPAVIITLSGRILTTAAVTNGDRTYYVRRTASISVLLARQYGNGDRRYVRYLGGGRT